MCLKMFTSYKHVNKTYCSVDCSGKIKGRHFTGGRRINGQGYVEIWSPYHPYVRGKGYVKEHRLVMEKHLKRFLDPKEVVHHKNGNKLDNRIENLELFESNGVHTSKHANHHKIGKWEKLSD